MQNFKLDEDKTSIDCKMKTGMEASNNLLKLASMLNEEIQRAYEKGRSGQELKEEDFFFPVRAMG